MSTRRWLRRVTIALAVLLAIAALGWWFVWRPVRPAAALLARLSGKDVGPTDLARAHAVRTNGSAASEHGHGWPAAWAVEDPNDDAPLVIVVAGVTDKGIDDPRVARLLLALHDADCAAVAPSVTALEKPGEQSDVVGPVVDAWRESLAPTSAGGRDDGPSPFGVRRRRAVAFLGVSLGGGAVLRAIAQGSPGDPPASSVSAVLLVGAPDDVGALGREWLRRPAADEKASAFEKARARDAQFARHRVLRSALPVLVHDDAERVTLRGWLDPIGEDSATTVAEPAGLSSPEAARWVRCVRAEGSIAEDDCAWAWPAARPFLESTSAAAIPAEGLGRVAAPVYLIHGLGDPLVPASEADALAARLGKSASVRVLKSRLLGHVEVGSTGLLDAWEHVRWVQQFLDAAAAAR